MEIRANYILVGSFTLLVLLGAFSFALWIGSSNSGVGITQYDISFSESVRGLSINNDVLFSGIRVGKVTQITISPVIPGQVRVRIAIAADTPVRENSTAQLELRGITGVSVVAISGGTAESPLLHVPEGKVGVIAYEPSPLASVVSRMPDVIAAATQTLTRLDRTFSEENVARFSSILASLEQVSGALGDNSEAIGSIVRRSDEALGNFNALLVSANTVLGTDAKAATNALAGAARHADSILGAVEPGLKQFSNQGLSNLRMLMVEMRNLVHILTRVSQKLESDPRRFLFGDTVKEYQSQ